MKLVGTIFGTAFALKNCGIRSVLTRAPDPEETDGAWLVEPGSYPWHVGIFMKGYRDFYLHCVGALIYDDIVLTSASCVVDPKTNLNYIVTGLRVAVGKIKKEFNLDEPNQQVSNVRSMTIPLFYQGRLKGFAKNLAILKLKESFNVTQYAVPLCLWSEETFPEGLRTSVSTGWGLDSSSTYNINLKAARGSIIDITDCLYDHYDPTLTSYFTTDKFCIIFDLGVKIRDEDNGAPVTIYHQGRHYLIGIISKQVSDKYILATGIDRFIGWIRNMTYELKMTEKCLHGRHFNCLGDSKCISLTKICDGRQDCKDNSDEDPVLCAKNDIQPLSTEKKCIIPEGVEIFSATKCGDVSGCTNKYLAPSNSIYEVTCLDPIRYGFAKPDVEEVLVVCTDGEWIPPLKDNKCLTLCQRPNYKSLDLTCNYLGVKINCPDHLKPTTKLEVRCKKQYKKKSLVKYADKTVCRRDGSIEHVLSECVPICGVPFKISQTQTLISDGEEVKNIKYPWHVALYWKVELSDGTNTFRYKCGGTLVDTDKVITAAHCVWQLRRSVVIEAEKLAVICGKVHSSWLLRDEWEQRVTVAKIIPGTHYNGAKTKHAQDIAVLILTNEVDLNDFIMPACLDLDRIAGGIPKDQPGHVVGWGSLSETDAQPSNVLMETWMTYMDLDTCRKKYERYLFAEYLQPDKFCAIYNEGSGTQTGDSGGGLTFTHDKLHYLYGVVSIKKVGQNEFAAFTDVLSHAAWLKEILNKNWTKTDNK